MGERTSKEDPRTREKRGCKNPYLCSLSPLHFHQPHYGRNALHIDTKFDTNGTHALLLLNNPHIDLIPQLLAEDALANKIPVSRERPRWLIGIPIAVCPV